MSATDDIATSSATSAAVTVAPLPAASPAAAHARPRLIAGIALTRLTSSGSRARVPVFTGLAGWATLRASPSARPAGHRGEARGAGRSHRPGTRATSEQLAAGRATITLHKLDPGSTYRLVLVIHSADGQTASDAATLRVRAR